MNWSQYQTDIFDFIEHRTESLVIDAVAGSGKSSTIIECTRRLDPYKSVLFLAFNKNIQLELESKLPSRVTVATFHSHAFKALCRNLPKRPRWDGDKIYNILKRDLSYRDFQVYYKYVSRLVSYAKNSGMGFFNDGSPNDYQELINHFNLVPDSQELDESVALGFAQDCLHTSNSDVTCVDFDDMLYLTLIRKCTFDKHQFVFLDEAQDTNAVQRELLYRMFAPQSRLIAVGDPYQSIYGFRGASHNAMDEIRSRFSCQTLPLSVSYRCSHEVIKKAQEKVKHIRARDGAPDGVVNTLASYKPEQFESTSAIICRNTAPIVSFAYALIRNGTSCKVLGREIGKGLVELVKKIAPSDETSIDTLLTKLDTYEFREVAKAQAQNRESLAAAVEDKCSCIRAIAEQLPEYSRTIPALLAIIDSIFADTNSGSVTLCTIHKSKGLEWETVFFLDRDLCPSKYAKRPWELIQEDNLLYVGYTRAKTNLYFIKSGRWDGTKEVKKQSVMDAMLEKE